MTRPYLKFDIRTGRPIEDDDDVLRDGQRISVPLMMRDAMTPLQRAIAEDKAARVGFSDALCRHQPGPVVLTDQAGRERKAQAYAEMCDDLQNAYKTPSALADVADQRRKRKITTRDPFGRETGTWEEEEEEDAASDAAPTMDAAEGRRRKREAYDAMVSDLCNAWRNPPPLPVAADAAPPVRRDAALVGPTYDVVEGRRRKREAYDRMCAEMCDAWRS